MWQDTRRTTITRDSASRVLHAALAEYNRLADCRMRPWPGAMPSSPMAVARLPRGQGGIRTASRTIQSRD